MDILSARFTQALLSGMVAGSSPMDGGVSEAAARTIAETVRAGVDVNGLHTTSGGFSSRFNSWAWHIPGLPRAGVLSAPYLLTAVARNSPQLVELLLSLGADPNTDSPLTPLYMAAALRNVGVMRHLLDHGADPSTVSPLSGEPPIVAAARMCTPDAVAAFRLLLDAGVDPATGYGVALAAYERLYVDGSDKTHARLQLGLIDACVQNWTPPASFMARAFATGSTTLIDTAIRCLGPPLLADCSRFYASIPLARRRSAARRLHADGPAVAAAPAGV